MPPLTGESTHATPFSAAALATTFATLGPVVERSIIVFTAVPFSTPSMATACSTGGVGRLRNTTSAFDATSAGDDAIVAPRSASGFITAAFVSKITSECPASSSRDAIGPPMRPTPTKPKSATKTPYRLFWT